MEDLSAWEGCVGEREAEQRRGEQPARLGLGLGVQPRAGSQAAQQREETFHRPWVWVRRVSERESRAAECERPLVGRLAVARREV